MKSKGPGLLRYPGVVGERPVHIVRKVWRVGVWGVDLDVGNEATGSDAVVGAGCDCGSVCLLQIRGVREVFVVRVWDIVIWSCVL